VEIVLNKKILCKKSEKNKEAARKTLVFGILKRKIMKFMSRY
jgi:hypothetical protein